MKIKIIPSEIDDAVSSLKTPENQYLLGISLSKFIIALYLKNIEKILLHLMCCRKLKCFHFLLCFG